MRESRETSLVSTSSKWPAVDEALHTLQVSTFPEVTSLSSPTSQPYEYPWPPLPIFLTTKLSPTSFPPKAPLHRFHRRRLPFISHPCLSSPPPPPAMVHTSASGSFASFFQQWLVLHDDYLRLLETRVGRDGTTAADDDDGLVWRVLGHYGQYYEEKSRAAAEEDVLQYFTPPWLSGLERAFLWVGRWKPTLAFRLLRRLTRPLSPEQEAAAEQMAAETRRAELELEQEQAKAQERLGSPEVVEAARQGGAAAVAELKESLGKLLAAADGLRMKTAGNVVEILSAGQAAEFLATAARMYLEMRRQGAAMAGRRGD